MSNEFSFPNVPPGTWVRVYDDPGKGSNKIGFVCRSKHSSVDVVAFSTEGARGLQLFLDCWHVDDPRVANQPHIIQEDPERGVFELTDSEKRARRNEEMFAAIEKTQMEMVDELNAVSEKLKALERRK